MDTKHLDDEALAATAYVWHERVPLSDRQARQIADQLDAELRRRLGPTPSQPMPLHSIEPSTLEGWTTSLDARQFDAKTIIALYADHGTHEQFHSEFKTDLDLERLPSGKFSTNYLVCELAALVMNILRLMGQAGLLGPDAPVRHPAKRRRVKTVMQELIYRAGRLIAHGRQVILGLGANHRAAKVFRRLHAQFFAACD